MAAEQNLLEAAILHHRVGRLDEAERLYREVLAHAPDHPQATFHLGVLALQSRRHDDAIALFARATALAPNNPACLANLGEAQRRGGQLRPAVDSLLNAMALHPDLAEPVYSLALVLQELGAVDGALAYYRRAAELKPDLPDLQARLAATEAAASERLREGGERCEPSEERAEDVLSATTLMALAWPLALKGRLRDAVGLLERVVQLQPKLVAAHCNLGVVHTALGEIGEAAASYRRALEIEPDMADTHHNLGNALLRGGSLDEALLSFRRAVALRPQHAAHHSDVVFHLHFHPACDSRAILAEARAWDRAHAAALAAQRDRPADTGNSNPPLDRTPERRLRIGYVSPNFRRHCQAFFLFPLLAHHHREAFEIFCYSDVAQPDEWTTDLLRHADQSRSIAGMTDAAIADRVREDRIDILVDLTMHMAGNRLLVFARKPAPVQVCWLAYPGTTGLTTMDYRFTDPYLDPPDSDPDVYAERSVRLPNTFWCYEPRTTDDGVSPLPAREQGHIRFGCLNNFLKVNDGTIALWARVLQQIDGSTLTLLAPAGDARKTTLDSFAAHGIDPVRVEFVEYQARLQYLSTYRSIDVCLDTFPYNGHTTSLDAFWMGVPVVTLVGATVVGRAGLSQATNLGLPELVARTPDEYVRTAADLCKDLNRLSELRAGLRTRMERSPLMDAPRFARDIEAAYRSIWMDSCAGR